MLYIDLRTESGPKATTVSGVDAVTLLDVDGIPGQTIPPTGYGAPPLSPSRFADAVQGRNLVLVTHGFNVNFQNGLNCLAGLAEYLALDPSFLVVGVLWPGDYVTTTIPINYIWDHHEAVRSGDVLAGYLERYASGAAGFNFVSHSLGARVVLECLVSLKTIHFNQVCLLAAAVNADAFKQPFLAARKKADRFSILASKADKVLMLAYPLGNGVGLIGDDIAEVASELGVDLGKWKPPVSAADTAGPMFTAAMGRGGANPHPRNLVINGQIPQTFLWLDRGDGVNFKHGDYYPAGTAGNNPKMPRPLKAATAYLRPALTGGNPAWPVARWP